MLGDLARLDPQAPDAERVDRIRLLDGIKSAAAAAQALETAAFVSSQKAAHLVETVTPTGHTYRSRAPDPPGTRTRDCRECEELARRAATAAA